MVVEDGAHVGRRAVAVGVSERVQQVDRRFQRQSDLGVVTGSDVHAQEDTAR